MKRKLKIYLIGAIEAAPDLGAGWRQELTPFLEELGLEVLDPCKFEPEQLKGLRPNQLPEFYTDKFRGKVKPSYWHDLKNAQEPNLYKRFLKYMHRIIRYDTKIVTNESDLIVCYWNKSASKGAGTHSELTLAFLNNVPVYCVAECDIPAWAKACCTEIFTEFDELKLFLREEFSDE